MIGGCLGTTVPVDIGVRCLRRDEPSGLAGVTIELVIKFILCPLEMVGLAKFAAGYTRDFREGTFWPEPTGTGVKKLMRSPDSRPMPSPSLTQSSSPLFGGGGVLLGGGGVDVEGPACSGGEASSGGKRSGTLARAAAARPG